MIKVTEIGAIIPEVLLGGLSSKQLGVLVENLAAAARAEWIRLAASELSSSSFQMDYMNGIQEPVMTGPGRAVVSLVGDVAEMVEHGSPSVDMRSILLNPAVTPVVPMGEKGMHESKSGDLYRAIPLRHRVPGAKGVGGGKSMGSQYTGKNVVADAAAMGKAVYNAAKKLPAYKSGARTAEQRLPEGVGGAVPLANVTTGTTHKTDIYAGMVREEKTYEKATQSQYLTFRTISEGVQDGSWIRKEIPAVNFAEKVAEYIGKIANDAIVALVEGK